MNNSIKRALGAVIICGLACLASCSDMLDTKTNSYLNTDDNRLQSPNDSLYSLIGIAKQLQQLGERYVLLGELRGELMSVTNRADIDLQAIADFTATTGNRYVSTREYYAVINNCNYFLQHVDTSIVAGGKRIMLGEYALVKTIRAWTYLQLGLNYGKATWLVNPILDIDEMNQQYEELNLEALVPRLIADILPYLYLQDYPSYGSDIERSFIPVPILLADLYLWQGAYTGNQADYEAAAWIYYRWFTSWSGVVFGTLGTVYSPGWHINLYQDSEFRIGRWGWSNAYEGSETVSGIRYNTKISENPNLPPLLVLCSPGNAAESYWIKPSQAAMDLWENEMYAFYRSTQKDVVYTKGDLRGHPAISGYTFPLGSYGYTNTNEADSVPYIAKLGYLVNSSTTGTSVFLNSFVTLYREGQFYLRYAEALNALGKPSLAFAVLKHGMKAEILTDPTKVAPDEVDPLPGYCDFMDDIFSQYDDNFGVHGRGSGNCDYDTIYYAFTPETLLENRAYYGIPAKLDTKADSIAFVNVMICKELGMETAFEGNRFHDLMRLSKQYERWTGKSDFLSKWVGRRNPAAESKLADPANWYLPTKQE